MQIDVRLADFSGLGPGLMPMAVGAWLDKNNISYEFVGSSTTGIGYNLSNGRSNREASFLLRGATSDDMLVFKIQFPTVKIHND